MEVVVNSFFFFRDSLELQLFILVRTLFLVSVVLNAERNSNGPTHGPPGYFGLNRRCFLAGLFAQNRGKTIFTYARR